MENFITINIKDKEYVFVDTYEYNKKTIYHFGNLEEEIFCFKINDEFVPINNKFDYWMIKNKFGLIDYSYLFRSLKIGKVKISYRKTFEHLDKEKQTEIKEEQIKNFEDIVEKFGLNLNENKLNNIISNVKIFSTKSLRFGWSGLYRAVDRNIIYKENHVDGKDAISKRVRLHEFIHALTKNVLLYNTSFARGLLEGETENLVEDFFDDNTSSKIYKIYDGNKATVFHFNFSKNCTYEPLVAIVKQMEYALGKKSHQSVLDGKMDFEKEFAQKYGNKLLILMAFRTRRLCSDVYKMGEYLKKTQNILLETVFDKDFEEIENLDDAEKYFEKLKGFELNMVRISDVDHIKETETKDLSYQNYYNRKLEEIKKLLHFKGLPDEDIEKFLNQYAYQKQEFNPIHTKEQENEIIKKEIVRGLASQMINENKIISLQDCTFTRFKIPNGYSGIVFMHKDGYIQNRVNIFDPNDELEQQKIIQQEILDCDKPEEWKSKKFVDRLISLGFTYESVEIDINELNKSLIEELEIRKKIKEDFIKDNLFDKRILETKQKEIEQINNLLTQYRRSDSQNENKNEEIEEESLSEEEIVNFDKSNFLNQIIENGKNFVRTSKLNLIIDKIKLKYSKRKEENIKDDKSFLEK